LLAPEAPFDRVLDDVLDLLDVVLDLLLDDVLLEPDEEDDVLLAGLDDVPVDFDEIVDPALVPDAPDAPLDSLLAIHAS
jgi:hypothetical protein